MLSFVLGWRVSPFVAPAALALSLAAVDWLARKEGLRTRERLATAAIAVVIVGISFLLAGAFYDMSWDGLWYHQTAVFQMAHGWDPLSDPMRSFVPHLQDWVRHYAKGPWYVALGFYALTGDIEVAKAAPWIALAAVFSAVMAASGDCGLRRRPGILVAALVSLNPVTVFELASYLVDGLMISFLGCFAAALFRWFRRPSPLVFWVMSASAFLCINTKFTGLVYLCFAAAAGGLYVIIVRRDLFVRYVTIQSALLLLGVLVFGFNPYVTNTIHRGHPFYPLMGTAEYPSHSEQGEDAIERWETPHNMLGRSRFFRLGYALFGRPGAQPFYPGENASLMVPFDVGRKDFEIYYFHDVRISGFGPLFSGAFLVSLALMVIAMLRPGFPRLALLLVGGTIILSLLISPHTWWARYGPQLWWFPVFGVVIGLAAERGGGVRALAWILAVVLLLNVLPIAIVHYRWESEATRTTNEQMAWLRDKDNVEVDFRYFGEPFGERLKTAGVRFTPVQTLQCPTPIELMSVSPGYPEAVRVCIKE